MKMRNAFITFIALITICPAQSINISGTVKGSEGIGIEGAIVRLGIANIATTTDTDGMFQLVKNATGAKLETDHRDVPDHNPVTLRENRLFFNATEQTEARVRVYDCSGKLLFSHDKPISSKKHSLTLPHLANGIYICYVLTNNEQHTFTIVTGMASTSGTTSLRNEYVPAKQAKIADETDDALLFTKEGYELYRLPVTTTDTSDLRITMTPLETGTVTDADGNEYRTVRIGNQVWTSENLRTTKYNDGSNIPLVTNASSWGMGTGYCFYDNSTDPAEQEKWGALYNWNAVNTGKLAPKGWHVSTDADWDTLQNYLMSNGYNYDGTISFLDRGESENDENKIAKSLATKTDWPVDSTGTGSIGNDLMYNNASGFSAVPGGSRYYDGTFTYQGTFCFFWTSTSHDASFAWYRMLWDVLTQLDRSDRVKSLGCSIRLVRDN